MPDNERTLITLAVVFAPLSLISFGGGPSVFAEMQREAVSVHGWLTEGEFTDFFAMSRIAPGPGALLVTFIGWKVAGWLGVLVVSLAFFLPSSLLAYAAGRVWDRWRGRSWHAALQRGLAPIVGGLIMAGAFALLRSAHSGFLEWGTALSVAAARICWPAVHPLALLSVAASIFVIAEVVR
jgi:chromate transporter